MGAGVSDWRLAKAVSRVGQLGVVSGTALDQILVRRLQEGDVCGSIRRAMQHFPFPKMAQQVLDHYFIRDGKDTDAPYKRAPMHTVEGKRFARELCIVANFVEVFLAREGHTNPVGINYLEKIQFPHLPSLYGAMLAGVAVVIVGAGIPVEFPGVIERLTRHEEVSYPAYVQGAERGEMFRMLFNPVDYHEEGYAADPLVQPDFLPIISSDSLAKMLLKRANGPVAGFIVEVSSAGGHNAPPRGALKISDSGEPLYGPRDEPNLEALRKLGFPFWLAGSYGSPERLEEALEAGAAGVQVGSAFALCKESGLVPSIKHELILRALRADGSVFTDPKASPTGFPFKVAALPGSQSDPAVYEARKRVCDLGYLRQAYRREDGSIGYRCAAEPVKAYMAKGGAREDTENCCCLCNALMANIGLPQRTAEGVEPTLVTLGDDYINVGRFCTVEHPHYTAQDVLNVLLASQSAGV
jgi:nitronate monooxygenase